MLGAIAGDIIGSRFEFNNIHSKDFDLFVEDSFFTDDTVMTCAITAAAMGDRDYASAMRRFGNAYPNRRYGSRFGLWLGNNAMGPYGSFGNGSAMRVSSIPHLYAGLEFVCDEAERSAAVTHNHPEGIKGAQATAGAIFLARTGAEKDDIKQFVAEQFAYDLERSVDRLREEYRYNETCQETVPEAVICFLESTSFEDAIRNAISIGGDSDTLACITGSIAEAYYGEVPEGIRDEVLRRLPKEFIDVINLFEVRKQRTHTRCPECLSGKIKHEPETICTYYGPNGTSADDFRREAARTNRSCLKCDHKWNERGQRAVAPLL